MDSIIAEFLAESAENLDQLDQDLVSLEKHPDDREVFARIFRTIHTIKGTCGFLAFSKLETVTHIGESLLSRLREGSLTLRPEITTDLLAMIDAVRTILANIDRGGGEGDDDFSDLIDRLRRFDEQAESARTAAPEADASAAPADKADAPRPGEATDGPLPASKKARKPRTKGAPKAGGRSSPRPGRAQGPEPADEAEAVDGTEALEPAAVPTAAETNIRVDVRVLDHLMNLVGELVLARNQLIQHLSGSSDARLAASSQRLDSITGELQEAVMRTRMQPISSIWQKLPRYVRDLSHTFAKEVEIEMEGEDTDLDKSIIEAIKGSLLHLVRNAIDHGIESPELRASRGKPRVGTLRLRAHHEGGHVVIEVRDDGAGLDHERILQKALAAGLVAENELAELDHGRIESLVFRPGFSTAGSVTNISGRGVGLDVVRSNVESLGGSIELRSEPGVSTTFRIKLPLTLAIVSVLLVAARGHRIAIPQASVVELVRIAAGASELGIEDLNGVAVYRLRGKLLPLVFLNRELGLDSGSAAEGAGYIAVLQGDDRRFGLVVDAIEDSQEIVVKPLGRMFADAPFAGATILGNGQIALILDVFRFGLAAGVVSESRAHSIASQISSAVSKRGQRARLVYLQGRNDERLAVDFEAVTRLEHFPRSSIEWIGDRQVVQYGDRILRLINLQQALPERRVVARDAAAGSDGDTVPVVVCSIGGRLVGLVVHRIVDIVEESLKARRAGSRDGVQACAVIKDRVTEIIDVEKVVRLADPGFFEQPADGEAS
jgi:two-component system chemotaxis sensor kinase CheA